jgi:hypothetical protein
MAYNRGIYFAIKRIIIDDLMYPLQRRKIEAPI